MRGQRQAHAAPPYGNGATTAGRMRRQGTAHHGPSAGNGQAPGDASDATGLVLGMPGAHQLRNASLAVAAIEALRARGHAVSDEAIRDGLAKARLRGRFELHPGKPMWVFDCAHNQLSARALRQALDDYLPGRQVIFVLGFSMDKDIPAIIEELAPRAAKVVLTRPRNPRAAAPEDVRTLAEGILPDPVISPDVPAALEAARRLAGPDDVVCVTGSFYVVGEAMEAFPPEPQVSF